MTSLVWTSTRAAAEALDRADELAPLRSRYGLPAPRIRLDGSSGPRSRSTPAKLRDFVEHRWDHRAPTDGGRRKQARLAAASIAPLIGALPSEVDVAESASMNLFSALLRAAGMRPGRPVLAVGKFCFATDHYLARSAADFAGCELRLFDDPNDLPELLDDRVAVLALSHIDPESGAVRDATAITELAHRHGALTLWDLSHSAGAMLVDLTSWGADFAIGCGHRYLGGGSGAPGFSYLAQQRRDEATDADAFLGAPSTLAISELRSGLSALTGASPAALEAKATGLAEFFLRCLADTPGADPVPVPEGLRRGPHVCVRHRHAHHVAQALLGRGVVVDVPEPNTLRFGFAPLWLRYVDVREAAGRFRDVLQDMST